MKKIYKRVKFVFLMLWFLLRILKIALKNF